MRKNISLALVLILLLQISFADIYSVFGGIKGDLTMSKGLYYYQEVTFVTGKPVVLKGTVKIPEIPKDKDNYKLKVDYSLTNEAQKIELERSVNYEVTKEFDKDRKQEIINSNIPVGGIKEDITVGSDVYTLTSFQQNNSELKEINPAIAFESGNTFYKKIFHKNGDEKTAAGRLTITGESRTHLGYDSKWSKLTTRVIDVAYDYQPLKKDEKKTDDKKEDKADKKEDKAKNSAWDGNVVLKFSTDTSSDFSYVRNDVQNISFRGGLLKSENTSVMLEYDYKILDPSKVGTNSNNKYIEGKANLNTYSFETATRLVVPKFKDIIGHWAEEEIFRLGSLEAFDSKDFFFPDNYITREEFAMALINSISHLEKESPEERRSEAIKAKRKGAKPLIFTDVNRESPYYVYVAEAQKQGLMEGVAGYEGNEIRYQFLPTRPLTRQEATTVIVRSLGIEDIAPALPYDTGFNDDKDISTWAKDGIYMAREVGIVKGYPDNTARPLELVTRAEAATMLSQLVDHLRDDITIDYRDKLLNAYSK